MEHRNWVEWTVLGVSVIAIVAVVGLLVADGVSGTSKPPNPVVEAHPEKAYVTDHGWLLPVTVSNDGERPAQSVSLVATATVDGEEEEADITIDYLPAGTDVNITFGFSAEPPGAITYQVVSFVE